MNPHKVKKNPGGDQAASDINSKTEVDSEASDVMKRAAAKRLIERYYYQLTDGCGDNDCRNENCASCNAFVYKNCSRNQLAVHALHLFKQKARLCEAHPAKIAKRPSESEENATTSVSCMKSGDLNVHGTVSGSGISVRLDGGGSSSSAGGVRAHYPVAMVFGTKEEQPSTSNMKPSAHQESTLSVKNFLTEQKLIEIIKECKKDGNWSKLIHIIGAVFNNPDAIILSFRRKDDVSLSKETHRAMQLDLDKDMDEQENENEPCRSAKSDSVMESTVMDSESLEYVTVDIPSVRRAFKALMEIPELPFQCSLIQAICSLSKNLDVELRYRKPIEKNPNYINIFIIIMEIPFLYEPEFIDSAFPDFCNTIGQLPLQSQVKLAHVWSKYPAQQLKSMVCSLHQLITVRVMKGEVQWGRGCPVNDDSGISGAARVMKILYYASMLGGIYDSKQLIDEEKKLNDADVNFHELVGAVAAEPKDQRKPIEDPLGKELGISPIHCRTPLVPFEDFVNDLLNEYLDVGTDFSYYKSESSNSKFSFVNHSFLLTTCSKHTVMYFDNRIHMLNERRTSLIQTLVHGAPTMPYLRLKVRRERLIEDALVAVSSSGLFVFFSSSFESLLLYLTCMDMLHYSIIHHVSMQSTLQICDGVDEGGVSKEFFQLVVEDIFNPDFGMFTYKEETGQYWFNPSSLENDGQFTLIGIVLGLAIYNSAILDIHFPMVVYRKLMGKKGTFTDLKDVDPILARSLHDLLQYDGEVEKEFMQAFCISYRDVFGNVITQNLKENGDQIPVTNANKREYVNLYADYLLNRSVERQFRAFKCGFRMVTNESPLHALFRPEEVELLVCGSKQFDFHALEEATEYDGGFTNDSATIRNFWSVVHDFTEEQQRKLLQFTTGTDRVPIGGLSKVKLIIARNGPDSDR
ncbi:ubiquitin-protein ligase E3A [Octopus bimaculoides]|uniref:ubiquitin-protein ligase E3A n=1 Tax=Octopus bimaculoides TaxID=37653 RepID=UPI00071C67FE|nr:ubiquitin-protein ligase E3A [Octopus bimaculoides]|eukprot:XP_014790908.1 PREDICTED: ubiquitin-protein ligase E3A-like [Octopus bimaculoides]